MCAAVQVLIASCASTRARALGVQGLLRRAHCENRVCQRTRRSIRAGVNIIRKPIVVVIPTLHASTAVGERRGADATRVAGIAKKFERHLRIY
jgi:hypothetical protein